MVLPGLKRFSYRAVWWAGILGLILAAETSLDAATSYIVGQPPVVPADLSQFKTPQTVPTIRIDALRDVATGRMSFLGIMCGTNASGELAITAVAPGSPAAKAGVQGGDIITAFGGQPISTPFALRALIESIAPGPAVKFSVRRDGDSKDLMPRLMALGAVCRPIDRIRLGAQVSATLPDGGVKVTGIDDNSPGAAAGLKPGDVILRVNDMPITETNRLDELLEFLPAITNTVLTLNRGGQELSLRATLAPPGGPDRPATTFAYRPGFGPRGYNARARRDSLKIAIVGLEFPDVHHNPHITPQDWEKAFFSTKTYVDRNATGQAVHGSINDFYQEQSSGTMHVEGKMLGWLPLARPRAEFSGHATTPTDASAPFQRFNDDGPLLAEALGQLVTRNGRSVLSDYDGIFFIYAGEVATRKDTDVYWPHTSSAFYDGSRVRFSISFEGGGRMTDISILCHELGHILGLPDLYVRPQTNLVSARGTPTAAGTGSRSTRSPRGNNPYVESLANWDLMADQVGNGRPQHLSAWSKEQIGFITPAVIDPRVPQQIVLGPIENSTNQCIKIPLRPDGSEYLLLENRRHIGFDASVPAEGLLIWRVVYGRPVLEEAHGYSGANAASISPSRIPYPTLSNNSFTPFTAPSSAAYTGDELPVYITNIQRLADGRIVFAIGRGYM